MNTVVYYPYITPTAVIKTVEPLHGSRSARRTRERLGR
jgi:hypothetical protein